MQNLTDLLTLCGSFLQTTPQIDRPAGTVSTSPMRDTLESRKCNQEPESAEITCGTPTATSHLPARPSFAYGRPAGNWDVVDSSHHERQPTEDSRVGQLAPDPEVDDIIGLDSLSDLLASCSGVLTDEVGCTNEVDFPGTARGTLIVTAQTAARQTLIAMDPLTSCNCDSADTSQLAGPAGFVRSKHTPDDSASAPPSPCSEDMVD